MSPLSHYTPLTNAELRRRPAKMRVRMMRAKAAMVDKKSFVASAKRALNILFTMFSGNIVFHEKKLWIKIASFILITVGLVLLVK